MSGIDKKLVRAWVRQQSGPARRAALPVVFIGCASTLLGIGQAWCLAAIIGQLFHQHAPSVSGQIAVFAGLAVLRALALFAQEHYAAKAGVRSRERLRRSVIDSVFRIGPALLRRQHSAEIAALLVDRIEALDGYFARWLPASMTWMIFPILVLVAVFAVDARAALILAICGALVPVAQAVFGIGAALASRNQFLAMVRLQARFLDRIRGIATIVLSNAVEREASALARAADELRQRTVKILRVAFFSSAAIDVAMVLAIILIVLSQGHFIHIEGGFSAEGSADGSAGRGYADLVNTMRIHPAPHFTQTLFALFLIPEFFAPFRGLALAYQDRAQAAGAAEAMEGLGEAQAVLDEPGPAPAWPNEAVTVEARNLSFAWGPDRPNVFENLNVVVGPGEALLLDGPSGAGKSTLIELILGFIHPSQGAILFNGQNIATMRGRDIARHLAWIGQKPVIFAGSLRDNLLFARPDADEAALSAAIKAASVDAFLKDLPAGLETEIGEGGFGLSGGQAQRIAIARAYLKDAPLLLLDEPTAHLDPETEAEIIAALHDLAQGRTVVLSSHSPAMQGFATRRLSLEARPSPGPVTPQEAPR